MSEDRVQLIKELRQLKAGHIAQAEDRLKNQYAIQSMGHSLLAIYYQRELEHLGP